MREKNALNHGGKSGHTGRIKNELENGCEGNNRQRSKFALKGLAGVTMAVLTGVVAPAAPMASAVMKRIEVDPPVYAANDLGDFYVSKIIPGEATIELTSHRLDGKTTSLPNYINIAYGATDPTDYAIYRLANGKLTGDTTVYYGLASTISGKWQDGVGMPVLVTKYGGNISGNTTARMYFTVSYDGFSYTPGRLDYSRCVKSSVFLNGLATECWAEKISETKIQYQPYDSEGNRVEIPEEEDAALTAATAAVVYEPGNWPPMYKWVDVEEEDDDDDDDGNGNGSDGGGNGNNEGDGDGNGGNEGGNGNGDGNGDGGDGDGENSNDRNGENGGNDGDESGDGGNGGSGNNGGPGDNDGSGDNDGDGEEDNGNGDGNDGGNEDQGNGNGGQTGGTISDLDEQNTPNKNSSQQNNWGGTGSNNNLNGAQRNVFRLSTTGGLGGFGYANNGSTSGTDSGKNESQTADGRGKTDGNADSANTVGVNSNATGADEVGVPELGKEFGTGRIWVTIGLLGLAVATGLGVWWFLFFGKRKSNNKEKGEEK